MKSVLIAIQPYWVFLIIAKIMGWEIDQEKTVEVRKTFPKDLNWNKKSIIYCSKNKQSFNLIPKKYQPLMEKFLGRVIGEFVCDRIYNLSVAIDAVDCSTYFPDGLDHTEGTCLTKEQLSVYLCRGGWQGNGYGWHITDLVIYDKPKELGEFTRDCNGNCDSCKYAISESPKRWYDEPKIVGCKNISAPQSWCYVWEVDNGT